MRLRNVKGAREEMLVNRFVVQNPEQYKGKWTGFFGNGNDIYIEVGMGKGKFIIENARQNPDINYIGIEKYSSVLIRAIEKQEQYELPNLFFLREDAERLEDIFGNEEIKRIYLNFSDPWPKDRHAKRRLTSVRFLKRYEAVLANVGRIEFKTDNKDLFDFSLQQVEEAGWELIMHTFDLHNSEYVSGNIMTEYEERFSQIGNPICKLMAKPQNLEK